MSNENSEDSIKISEYIQKNPDCKISKTITIILQGKRMDLQTFRLPLDLTYYNIKNGRFAAEYVDLVKNEGRKLDPKNSENEFKKVK